MKYYLGVDIGASTVKLGLMNHENTIVGTRRDFPCRANEGPAATLEVVKSGLTALLDEHDIGPGALEAVGVCCPTPVGPDGEIIYPTNIDKSWTGVNGRTIFHDSLGLPTFLLNDGDAAAYREYRLRAAAGLATPNMAQFITGTGLGGSIIINGELLVGCSPGVATELGHLQTDTSPEADRCGCGSVGCAETRASLVGLTNGVRHRQARGAVPSDLEGEPARVARRLRALAQAPSPSSEVLAIWETYFTHLGRAMRQVANTVGCNLIVISGGAHEREAGVEDADYRRFLDTAITWAKAELARGFPHLRNIRVEWAVDAIPDSAAYGAADYARAHFRATM